MRFSARGVCFAVQLATVALILVGPADASARPGRRPDAKARAPQAVPEEGRPPLAAPPPAAAADVSKRRRRPSVKGVKVVMNSANQEVVLEGQAAEGGATGGSAAAVDSDAAAPDVNAGDAAGDAADVPLPLDDGRWEVMCAPPCGRRLPRDALFRVTGAGVTTSATFALPAGPSSVTLEIHPGQARWYWTGAIAAIAGGTFILGSVGPRLMLGGSFATVEKVMAGTGVVLVGAGLPLWWFNRTRVDIF